MKFDLSDLENALDDASSVVFSLKAARDAVSEEVWDELPEEIIEVLDHVADLECSMGMEDIEG